MRHWKDCIIVAVLAVTWMGSTGCEETVKTNPEPVNQMLESRLVEEDAPVEEKIPVEPDSRTEEIIPAVELGTKPGPVADNNLCYACHLNFEKETLTLVHAQVNIGCVQCHGASDAHRLDEDTITPHFGCSDLDASGRYCERQRCCVGRWRGLHRR